MVVGKQGRIAELQQTSIVVKYHGKQHLKQDKISSIHKTIEFLENFKESIAQFD